MKELKHDTAGNTPEPWMRDAAAEIMSVWRGNVMPFNEQSMAKIIAARAPATPSQAQAFAESDCYRVRGADGISERVYVDIEAVTKFIRLLDAAPSQEASMPQYYFPCCRRFYAHAENCRAEPAPSPATKFAFCADCDDQESCYYAEMCGRKVNAPSPATKDMPQLESWMTREAFEWMNAALGLDAELHPYLADLIPAKAEISGLEREQWQKVVDIILRSADHADVMPQSLKDREPRKGPHSLKLRREV